MGGETVIQQPQPVAAPTATASISEYIANQPRLFELQQQQAPLEAQQQLELLQEFGPQMGAAVKAGQEALAPETSAIQEELAATARERMQGGLSPEERAQFLSDFSGQLGTNIGSPIGALATSRSLMLASQQRQREGENLGLSLAGRQQLAQPQAPSVNNLSGSLTPGQVMNFNQGIYGTQGGMFGAQAGMYNQQLASQPSSPLGLLFGGVGGAAAGGLGSGIGGYMTPTGSFWG